MRWRKTWNDLQESMWLLPGACTVAAIALSLGVESMDRSLEQDRTGWFLFGGGPEGARSLLTVVATSVLTFSVLVFSVTVLVLQLASSQFSPRVLRTFLRDWPSKLALGVFVGAFVYALFGLRLVRGSSIDSPSAYVPSLTVWIGLILAIACVGSFIFYIHHVAQSVRAVVVIRRIGRETRRALEGMYPEQVGEAPEAPEGAGPARPGREIAYEGPPGVIQRVAADALLECARRTGAVVALVPQVGDFVAPGSLVARVWDGGERLEAREVLEALEIGEERTLDQDSAFGFRQLVDIAERALSPGVNDPSTAVQALDELHAGLQLLVTRRFPPAERLDDDGALRLVLPRPDFAQYLRLAVDEIHHYGKGSLQVSERLRRMLQELLRVAPAHRRPPIERTLAGLHAAAVSTRRAG